MSGLSAPAWLAALYAEAVRAPVPSFMRPPAARGGRRSAVLILFGGDRRGPDVLLIQRGNGLRRHSGQPAFPGGSVEDADSDAVACALREAQEETALKPSGVEVLGPLPELYLRNSGFHVTPVLAWWREPAPVYPADPTEVAAVARVPISELADPARRLRVRYAEDLAGPAFRVRGMVVWGFTAAILHRLLHLGGWELSGADAAAEEIPVDSLLGDAPAAPR